MSTPQPFVLSYTITGSDQVLVELFLGASNDISINWGGLLLDPVPNDSSTVPRTFGYGFAPGTYEIQIVGTSVNSSLGSFGDPNATAGGIQYLTSVTSFGTLGITSLAGAFRGATTNFTVPATLPSSVTNMSSMFNDAIAFNANISTWDVSNVTNMNGMFSGASAFNNDGAALGWTTIGTSGTQVDMNSMFQNATVFNQNISSWNVSNVTDMSSMFAYANAFNNDGVDLDWTTIGTSGTPVYMGYMFYGAQAFNQDLTTWDVSNVTNMTGMFTNSGLLTDNFDNMVNAWALLQTVQEDVILDAPTRSSYSNTGYDTLTSSPYSWTINAEPVTYIPPSINSGETTTFTYTNGNKQTVNGTRYDLYYNYGSVDVFLDSFIASSVSSSYTFDNVTPLIVGTDIFTIKKNSDDTVIDSVNVIVRGFSLTYTIPEGGETVGLYLGNADTITIDWGDGQFGIITNNLVEQYTNTYTNPGEYTITISGNSLEIFGGFSPAQGIQYLTSVNDFGDLGIISLSGAFQGATSNFTVPAALPSSVTDMSFMFAGAQAFNQDISSWNMTNVSNMEGMFYGALAFNNGGVALDWTDIGTTASSSVNMGLMFADSEAFNQSLSSWNTSNVSSMNNMFNNAEAFNQDISNWDTLNVNDMSFMFTNASAFNQDLSNWTITNVLDMEGMFSGSGLLTDNFDNMLNAWALQSSLKQAVTLNAPTRSSYSNSGYNILTDNPNQWEILVITEVTYTYELAKGYTSTFTYTNPVKPTILGSTYQLLYGSTVLSTFIASDTSGTSYTFENVVINTPGILVLTIQEVIFNNARSQGQRLGETYTIIDSVNVTINTVCFKEGSKILCFKNNVEKYVPIENIRKGDLVKTRLNGYVPVHMIGKSQMYHKKTAERRKEQLYTCSKEKFEEVFEDLVITGCHSILVDNFTSEKQREKAIETNNNRIFITEKKYRLPACVDDRTSVYDKEGLHTIYHLALENDDYYMNYGIYANGLLVETSSKRYLKDLSGMELIE